jgi:hypothetical protein
MRTLVFVVAVLLAMPPSATAGGVSPPRFALAVPDAAIGETVTSGTWELTLLAFHRDTELPNSRLPNSAKPVYPKGVFLTVILSAKNLASESATLPPFKVRDSAGRVFDQDGFAGLYGGYKYGAESGTITRVQPSLSANLALGFDIAPDAGDLVLRMSVGRELTDIFGLTQATVAGAEPPAPAPPQPAEASTPPPPPAPEPAVAAPAVTLDGRGRTATAAITPPSPLSVATFTHDGQRNFIVQSFRGDRSQLLVNVIGSYRGQRPIVGAEPLTFDIEADGAWTLRLEPIAPGGSPPFSGRGDSVSALFDPPPTGPWELSHDGQRNFIVELHCAGGSSLIQNSIGPFRGSGVVQFKLGPCLWEVLADGAWSLSPR